MIIKTDGYNERRYGTPWIAKITFESPTKPDFKFGEATGKFGEAGSLYIDSKIGDIIAMGQKDNRKSANSAPKFYIAKNEAGSEEGIEAWDTDSSGLIKVTIDEAYAHFIAQKPTQQKVSIGTRDGRLLLGCITASIMHMNIRMADEKSGEDIEDEIRKIDELKQLRKALKAGFPTDYNWDDISHEFPEQKNSV